MYGALASIVQGGAATEGFWVVWADRWDRKLSSKLIESFRDGLGVDIEILKDVYKSDSNLARCDQARGG